MKKQNTFWRRLKNRTLMFIGLPLFFLLVLLAACFGEMAFGDIGEFFHDWWEDFADGGSNWITEM